MSNTVEQDLNSLANLEAKIDFLRIKERSEVDELIPAEVQAEIETVKEQYEIEVISVLDNGYLIKWNSHNLQELERSDINDEIALKLIDNLKKI